MKKRILYILTVILVLFNSACTDLDETVYSELSSDTYITNSDQLNSVYMNMYAAVIALRDRDRFTLQELPADQFAWAQKGSDGYDGGKWIQLHYHTWNSEHGNIEKVWEKLYYPAAVCNYNLNLLSSIDYTNYGLTNELKEQHLAEAIILRSILYSDILDMWGNIVVPQELSTDLPQQKTVEEAFNTIVSNVEDNYAKLPKADGGDGTFGQVNQATAQMILARLYLNAESYGLEAMYNKCKTVCQNIINGEYGSYSLADTWYAPFDYDNNYCAENIFGVNTDRTHYGNYTKTMYHNFNHKNNGTYFDFSDSGNNGMHLQPSRDPEGGLYDFEFPLGLPYERFDDNDLRKDLPDPTQVGGGGMFLKGVLVSPVTGDTVMGRKEYSNIPIKFVDQVARFSEADSSEFGTLESTMTKGEECSGVRWVKYQMYPESEEDKYFEANFVHMRLAEVYYMLAECKMRLGESGYADLVNEVKERNYADGDFTPYTDATLTEEEFVCDHGREFLGEFMRRRVLIRFGYFNTGVWWDKSDASAETRQWFPIPETAIGANPNLKQNAGY